MNLFDSLEALSPIAKLVYTENIEALEKSLKNLEIDSKFNLTERITDTLINFAIYENKKNVVTWLISKGAKYDYHDTDSSFFLMACNNFDFQIVKLLLEKGAIVNAKDRLGKTAMTNALYGENLGIINLLIKYGYKLKDDGKSLRQAVADRQHEAVKIFLENNIDVNHHTPDSVFPHNPSPVCVAALNNDLVTVKLLVAHGADIKIKDAYGERPYNAAVKTKNLELIKYIKSLEPIEYHNNDQKISGLKKYDIPNEIIDILKSESRVLKISTENVSFIEFHSLSGVKEVDWRKHKFVDLLCKADNYRADGFLVWYPKKKVLAFADYEHNKFKILCTSKVFFKDPSKQIKKIFT